MGVFFVYMIKSAVCLAVFYLFYRLLLSKETFHRFNRIALLGILVLSCVIPFVEVTVKEPMEVSQQFLSLEELLLMAEMNASSVVGEATPMVAFTWKEVVLLVYLAGIVFFFCRNLCSLGRMLNLIRGSRVVKQENGITLIAHQKDIAPFSWMKFVVISEKDLEENGREILTHEYAHIRKWHSVDLLIADICIFFQWFNPASWLLKQELQNIHEYEADESVINHGVDAKLYQLLLIKKAVGTRLYSMANSFNHSKLKKRITMMLKEKSSPWARLKDLYVLPVAAVAVTAFARPEVSDKVEEISAVKVNDLAAIVETKVAESVGDTTKPAEVKYVPVEVGKQLKGTPVFEVVEEMPEFPGGGMSAFMDYIKTNMRYPASAREKGTQGRVTVRFVVDKDGSIKDSKILRSVDKDMDAEALRLINSMPKWEPGRQKGQPVAVKFTVPVMFRLEGAEMLNSRLDDDDKGKETAIVREQLAPPLYIIDGKEASPSVLGALKPESIANITILKDKSAEELYGEKGKYGVILITLKNGNAPVADTPEEAVKVVGVRGIHMNGEGSISSDADIYVDNVKIDLRGKELDEIVPADKIEGISVDKTPGKKRSVHITTKKSKAAEKASAQGNMKVEGKVVDEQGEPIVGAAVLIEGTTAGSITDVDGNFVLSVPSKDAMLSVSFIGVATSRVKAQPKLTVTLKSE